MHLVDAGWEIQPSIQTPFRPTLCWCGKRGPTPFHRLSGDAHLRRSLGAGPITASRPSPHSLHMLAYKDLHGDAALPALRRAERLLRLLIAGEWPCSEVEPRELSADHLQLVLRASFVEPVDQWD